MARGFWSLKMMEGCELRNSQPNALSVESTRWSSTTLRPNDEDTMRWTHLAAAAIVLSLTVPVAHAGEGFYGLDYAFEQGGVPLVKTTTVVPTQTVAGINNAGVQTVGNIGNLKPTIGITRGNGVTSPLVDVTTVVPTQTVAGIKNFGFQGVGGIANGPLSRKK
jgi:hypothetical protein